MTTTTGMALVVIADVEVAANATAADAVISVGEFVVGGLRW